MTQVFRIQISVKERIREERYYANEMSSKTGVIAAYVITLI